MPLPILFLNPEAMVSLLQCWGKFATDLKYTILHMTILFTSYNINTLMLQIN